MEFYERIKNARIDADEKQENIAKMLGITANNMDFTSLVKENSKSDI